MRREEKNIQSRQRILEAAMVEFAAKGYDGASLSTMCVENNISKGIIYHYFKDKEELYLLCVSECFEKLTVYLAETVQEFSGCVELRLREYFDARMRFFTENPLYLGVFVEAALNPPQGLMEQIAGLRRAFDDLNIAVLTRLLEHAKLRRGLSTDAVVKDFRMYMDFFHLEFKASLQGWCSPEQALKQHEEMCHRQIHVLLYGLLENAHEQE